LAIRLVCWCCRPHYGGGGTLYTQITPSPSPRPPGSSRWASVGTGADTVSTWLIAGNPRIRLVKGDYVPALGSARGVPPTIGPPPASDPASGGSPVVGSSGAGYCVCPFVASGTFSAVLCSRLRALLHTQLVCV
jgi:hypothetical protein